MRGPGAVPLPPEPAAWVGRATLPPPADPWATTPQPPVAAVAQPSIVYVEVPRRRGGGALLVVVLVIVALLLGGAAGLMLNPDLRRAVGVGPQPSAGPSPIVASPSPTPSPSPTAPGIGDAVQDESFQFVVTSVDCGHSQVGEGPFKQKADGQYCLVAITVQNVGAHAAVLLDSAQYAYTTSGRADDGVSEDSRYGADSSAGVFANHGIKVWVSLIQPGKSVSGILVFDIPKDASITSLELHDSAFSDGVVVTV